MAPTAATSDFSKTDKVEKSLDVLTRIQNMFTEDKGWDSEESMLTDMAVFRRERMKLRK